MRVTVQDGVDYPTARMEAVRAVDRLFLDAALRRNANRQPAAAADLKIDRKTFAQRHHQAFGGERNDAED